MAGELGRTIYLTGVQHGIFSVAERLFSPRRKHFLRVENIFSAAKHFFRGGNNFFAAQLFSPRRKHFLRGGNIFSAAETFYPWQKHYRRGGNFVKTNWNKKTMMSSMDDCNFVWLKAFLTRNFSFFYDRLLPWCCWHELTSPFCN